MATFVPRRAGGARGRFPAPRRSFDATDWSTNTAKRLELVKTYRELFQANYTRLSDLARYEACAAVGAVARAHVDMALDGFDDYIRIFPEVTWEKDYGERPAFGANTHRLAVHEHGG